MVNWLHFKASKIFPDPPTELYNKTTVLCSFNSLHYTFLIDVICITLIAFILNQNKWKHFVEHDDQHNCYC